MTQSEVQSLPGTWPRMSARCRHLRCDRGGALIELALVFAFFGMPLLLGTSQMGSLAYYSIEISNAAHAGSMYGMQNSTLASDNAGMMSAAQTEASDFGAALTVTPTAYYACSLAVSGTRYPVPQYTLAQATTACTGTYNHPLEFVQVNTSASVTPAIHCPGLATTFILSGSSVMEVEQ